MKLNRIMLIFVAIPMIALLTGCQSFTEDKLARERGYSTQEETHPDFFQQYSTDVEEGESQESKVFAEEILEVSDFHDNVSWVGVSDTSLLVDNKGSVLYDINDTPYCKASHYCNGGAAAYVNTGAYNYLNPTTAVAILDKSGNEVWTVEGDGIEKGELVYGVDALESVKVVDVSDANWNGYLLVRFEVDTFDYTGVLHGVVDATGKWVVEPPTIEEALRGVEDGIDPGNHSNNDTAGYDDYFICVNRQFILLYRTGEVLPCTGLWKGPGSGLYYGDKNVNDIDCEEAAYAHHDRKYDGYGKFLDSAGSIALDISNLPLTKDFGGDYGDVGYEEGFAFSEYCLVRLENSTGGVYLTVIDRNGNQMFEPVKNATTGVLGEKAFFYKPDDKGDGWFLKVDGTRLGEITGSEATRFSEEKAWIKTDDGWHCINSEGSILI